MNQSIVTFDQALAQLANSHLHKASLWRNDGDTIAFSRDTTAELMVILEGSAEITSIAGSTTHLKAGDVALIPAGFSGTWVTRTPIQKVTFTVEIAEEGDDA